MSQEYEHDLNLECFLLCRSAETVNGELYVLGGGASRLVVDTKNQVTEPSELNIALRVNEVSALERPITLKLELKDPHGDDAILPFEASFQPDQQQPDLPFAISVIVKLQRGQLLLQTPGLHRFILHANGAELGRTPLYVTHAQIETPHGPLER
jgi:hypothetical protein